MLSSMAISVVTASSPPENNAETAKLGTIGSVAINYGC